MKDRGLHRGGAAPQRVTCGLRRKVGEKVLGPVD